MHRKEEDKTLTDMERALRRNGWIIGAFGVGFAATAVPPLHGLLHVFLQLAYWPLAEIPKALPAPVGLGVAISGGVTAGLGAALWALGRHVAPVAPEAARAVARRSGWVWFIVDGSASAAVGAPFNIVLNLIFLALILLPVRDRNAAP